MDLEDVGLRLLLAGMGLGMALMTFVVTFDSTSFYQTTIAPTALGAMRPLGYALDAAVVLSLALSIGGTACFSRGPDLPPTPASAPARGYSAAEKLDELRRTKARATVRTERARKRRAPGAPHGST